MAINHETGRETPDPTPLARAVRFKRPPTLEEIVQRTIKGALSRHAAELGHETFDEANDFDVSDGPGEFSSRHEFTEQDEEDLRIWKEARRQERIKATKAAAQHQPPLNLPLSPPAPTAGAAPVESTPHKGGNP